jgi:hypothetical protein
LGLGKIAEKHEWHEMMIEIYPKKADTRMRTMKTTMGVMKDMQEE